MIHSKWRERRWPQCPPWILWAACCLYGISGALSPCPPGVQPTTHLLVRPTGADESRQQSLQRRPEFLSSCAADTVLEFASVVEAQDALREGLGAGGMRVVNLLGGDHHLSSPLRFDSRDSNVVWRSAPGQHARLTGGVRVPRSALSPSPVPSGASGVLRAELAVLGLNASELGAMAAPYPAALAELFVNGAPAVLARAPSQVGSYFGYENLTDPTDSAFTLRDGSAVTQLRRALASEGGRGLWVHGYWRYDWMDTYINLVSISEAGVCTRNNATVPQNQFTVGSRFYALGSLDFLDSPGEYHVDRTTGVLHYLPDPSLDLSNLDLLISWIENVVVISGTSNLTLANLTISESRGDALVVTNASHLIVAGCTLRNAFGKCGTFDGGAPAYPLPKWSRDVLLRDNTVSYCGAEGLSVMSGNRSSLEPWNFAVLGNKIENVSRIIRTYTPAIRFNGVGLHIAGNHIANTPHTVRANASSVQTSDRVVSATFSKSCCLSAGTHGLGQRPLVREQHNCPQLLRQQRLRRVLHRAELGRKGDCGATQHVSQLNILSLVLWCCSTSSLL